MGNNKKVMYNVCYREMRSDVLKRHMKKNSKKIGSVPATNILVTNNIYNNPPSGTDLRVGLVGLGPGPPHFGGPTLSVLGLVGFI